MKLSHLLSLSFLILSLSFYFHSLKISGPQWKFWVLDTEHPKRFVSLVADSKGNPHIFYFNERGGGGLLYVTSKSLGNSFLDDLNYFFRGREWVYEVVDDRKNVGFAISSTVKNDKVYVAYQDSNLGRERLLYATKNGKWKVETVDKAEESGINVGMYTSIAFLERPIIFYFVEQGRKLMYAIKDENWTKKEIDRGKGLFITSKVCNDTIFLAYRERDGKKIYFAVFENGSFRFKKLNANADSQFSIALKNCEPYIAYFDDSTEKIYFSSLIDFRPKEIAKGERSRISLAYSNGFHLVYGESGKGLWYGYSKDGNNWNFRLLDKGIREGEYNSLAIDKKGNIHIAYLNRTALKYAEYNISSFQAAKTLFLILSFTFLTLGLTCLISSVVLKKFKRKRYKRYRRK